MGAALELLTFNQTDAPAAFAAMTANVGNSATIRNASANSKIWLLTAWGMATGQAVNVRVRSPLLHDNVQGIRTHIQVNNVAILLDPKFPEKMFPQDALLVEIQSITADAATNVHGFSMLVYYEDLIGAAANLISPDFLMAKREHTMTTENTITTTATGAYSGEEALSAELSQFKANTFYAIAGYTCDVTGGSVRYRGIFSSNLGVGGPAEADDQFFTMNFFVWLSERSGKPCIPAFNSADIAAVLIDATQDEGGADILVTTFCHQLRP